jgi:hypothetical protein
MIVNDNKPAIEFMADCANRIFRERERAGGNLDKIQKILNIGDKWISRIEFPLKIKQFLTDEFLF